MHLSITGYFLKLTPNKGWFRMNRFFLIISLPRYKNDATLCDLLRPSLPDGTPRYPYSGMRPRKYQFKIRSGY